MITCKFFPGQIFIKINAYKKVYRHFVKKKCLNRHIMASANPKVGKPYVNRFRMSGSPTPCKGYYTYGTPERI